MREAVNREKAGQLHVIIAANQQPDIHLPGNFASILMCFSITYRCSIIRMQPFSDTFPHKVVWRSKVGSREDKTRELSERVSINLAPPKVEADADVCRPSVHISGSQPRRGISEFTISLRQDLPFMTSIHGET